MTAIVIGPALVAALLAQSPTPPTGSRLPNGQQITVQDGDTVIVPGHTRIRLIRRVDAKVRALYSAADHRLILLVDEADATGAPDGRVDSQLVFTDVSGEWPLGERWEGTAAVDEYVPVDRSSLIAGYGFRTTTGLVQLLPSGSAFESDLFQDRTAVGVVRYRSASRGILGNTLDFDAAERAVLAGEARRGALTSANGASNPSAGAVPGGVTGGTPAPVRVGGGIQPPTKIVDVKPVYPAEAMASRPQGTVIIEATIGTDGTVQNAKVLRSIPLLDAAALTAVTQWRFTPTLVNGQPVPVIMTVAVNFTLGK